MYTFFEIYNNCINVRGKVNHNNYVRVKGKTFSTNIGITTYHMVKYKYII